MSVGRPPTVTEELLSTSAAELAPHKSLAAIESSGRFLLANIAVVGTLLTGLGIITSTELAATSAAWVLPSVGCTAVSLALAASAIVPSREPVNPADLAAVQRFYDRQASRRGARVIVAGWLFALAIPLAALPAMAATLDDPEPRLRLSARVEVDGDASRLVIAVGASGARTGTEVDTSVDARMGDGTLHRLARDRAATDDNGSMSSSFELSVAEAVRVTVKSQFTAPRGIGRTVTLDVPRTRR